MTNPINSNTLEKNSYLLFSNPLNNKNQSLILRIILLIAVIFIHILTFGLLLIYYFVQQKNSFKSKILSFQNISETKTTTKSSNIFSKNILKKDEKPLNSDLYDNTTFSKYYSSDLKKNIDPLDNIKDYVKESKKETILHTIKFNPDGAKNLDFKFSYPKTVLEFFKENNPNIFNDSTVKTTQIQNIYKQIYYLNEHYYISDIQGDGLCFFRSIGISWLFHLIYAAAHNPSIFQTAINLISSQINFINKVQTNKQLTENLLTLLKNLQKNPSLEKLLNVLSLPENEENLTVYLKKITEFNAKLYRKNSPEYLIPLITEDPLTFQQTIQIIEKNPLLNFHLLNFSFTSMSLIKNISQIIKCPNINSKSMIEVIIPLLNSLSSFLNSDTLEEESKKFIKDNVLSYSNIKLLWKNFLKNPHVQKLSNKTFLLFIFINYYNITSLNCLSSLQKQIFKNFLKNNKNLNPKNTCNETFIKNLNLTIENTINFSKQSWFNSMSRSFFQEIFSNVDLIQCSQTSINQLANFHKKICHNLALTDTQKLLKKLLLNKDFFKKLIKFLKLPLVEKILENNNYNKEDLSHLPLEILLLFINNNISFINKIIAIDEQKNFLLEETLICYQSNIQSINWYSYKKQLISVIKELSNPIYLLEKKSSIKEILNILLKNFFILKNRRVIKIFQKMLDLAPSVSNLKKISSFLKINYNTLWSKFQTEALTTFPQITQSCLTFLFLSQNYNLFLLPKKHIISSMKNFSEIKVFYNEFLTAWKENLSTSLETKFLDIIKDEINIIIRDQEALLRRILTKTKVGSIIQKNLNKIDPNILEEIYSDITSKEKAQAEADHVEVMSKFIPFGLCQYVGDLDSFSNDNQIKKHMTSYGFSNQFPETNPVTVLRLTNHYVALIKKPT